MKHEKSLLTLQTQIKIISNIIEKGTYTSYGLCACVNDELALLIPPNLYIKQSNNYVEDYIPLFTYWNAVLHARASITPQIIFNHREYYWWKRDENHLRLKFLKWALKKLEKQAKTCKNLTFVNIKGEDY